MPGDELRIYVEGLAELRKALKEAGDAEQTKEFRNGLKDAAEIVAKRARSNASAFSGRAASTIRATSGGNRVFVVGGKNVLPWYGWADFGSRKPKSGQPRNVGPWAHSGPGPRGGRFIYPALDSTRDEVEDAVADALDVAIRRAGFPLHD